jgi:hypothetical protein
MGKQFLPEAVKPSSGILVTCMKGNEDQATVYFEDKSPVVLKGQQITDKLNRYASEQGNALNKHGVTYIEMQSSTYAIDPSIQLVDSPGLEAYNMVHHERLTMENMLPTVDACIYVVTLKANSDKASQEILTAIHQHKKPIFIVQNMLDSVEPKLGAKGVLLKTKEEVADDLRKRMSKIVASISSELSQQVKIVQVSAKHALTYKTKDKKKYQDSQFDKFLQQIQAYIDQNSPAIAKSRLELLSQKIEEMKSFEAEEHESQNQLIIFEQRTKMLEETLDDVTNICHNCHYKNLEYSQKIQQTLKLTEKTIQSLDRSEIEKAKQALSSLFETNKNCYNLTIAEVQNTQTKLREKIKSFHFNLDEFLKSIQLRLQTNLKNLHLSTTKTRRTRRIKKSGVTSKISRFFGRILDNDWGYDVEEYDEEEINIQAVLKVLGGLQDEVVKPLQEFSQSWNDKFKQLQSELTKEISNRKTGLMSRKRTS